MTPLSVSEKLIPESNIPLILPVAIPQRIKVDSRGFVLRIPSELPAFALKNLFAPAVINTDADKSSDTIVGR